MDTFGRLCFASGASSIHNWETGSPELTALYEILKRTDGVSGARFSGAGFKGCCMALIDPRLRRVHRRICLRGLPGRLPGSERKPFFLPVQQLRRDRYVFVRKGL